jgi:succinate dehydrogenase / fumarate reductase cytochrome b subunit
VLAAFLGLHLWSFKFGTYYTTQLADEPVRDLARLVVEKFQHPLYAFGYSGVMLLLGFHLRHGIWSALQSLGLQSKAIRFTVYGASLGGAIAIATGFVLLPLTIYFGLLT